jgi:hypothetical protein
MNWGFDIDTRSLNCLVTEHSIYSVPISYADKYPISIRVVKSGSPYTFSGSVVCSIKPASRPKADNLAFLELLVSSSDFASGVLDLYTTELNDYLPPDGTTPLSIDITILDGGVEVSSLILPAPASRRCYMPGSPGPTSSASSLATEAEAVLGAINTKWMSPLRVRQSFDSFLNASGITLMP